MTNKRVPASVHAWGPGTPPGSRSDVIAQLAPNSPASSVANPTPRTSSFLKTAQSTQSGPRTAWVIDLFVRLAQAGRKIPARQVKRSMRPHAVKRCGADRHGLWVELAELPTQLSTTEHMQVNMTNRLRSVPSVIHGHAIAGLMHAFDPGHLGGVREQASGQLGLIPQVVDTRYMPPAPKHVDRSLGAMSRKATTASSARPGPTEWLRPRSCRRDSPDVRHPIRRCTSWCGVPVMVGAPRLRHSHPSRHSSPSRFNPRSEAAARTSAPRVSMMPPRISDRRGARPADSVEVLQMLSATMLATSTSHGSRRRPAIATGSRRRDPRSRSAPRSRAPPAPR